MRFADIPGHEDVKARLREMADSGRIPHALLLEGPAGTGKYALARALAQYIHCTNRTPDGDSCGQCPACRQHQSFNHIDTVFSFPILKRSSDKPAISDDYIDLFRDFLAASPYMDFDIWRATLGDVNKQPMIYADEASELVRRLSYMTRQSTHKIVLLWLPERMNEAAANKLLKLIEEPFGDTIFLLSCDNPAQLLPTIYSRTQRVTVRRYTDEEVAALLTGEGYDAATAHGAALIAEGNINEALKLASEAEERLQYFDLFVGLMRKAYARKVADLRQWSADVAALGRETSMQFIDYCTRLIRESFLMHLHNDGLLTVNDAERAFTAKFFPFINEKNVIDMIALFDDARRDIAGNGNAKIIFFDLAVRVIILIRRK